MAKSTTLFFYITILIIIKLQLNWVDGGAVGF